MLSMHLSQEQWGTTKGTVVNVAWFEQGNGTSLNKGANILLVDFFDASDALPLLIHDDSRTQEACQNEMNTRYSLV
jgi:hypothetical protein